MLHLAFTLQYKKKEDIVSNIRQKHYLPPLFMYKMMLSFSKTKKESNGDK